MFTTKEFNFTTNAAKIYKLVGNDWFAVCQDDDKVMLVDTDCEVAGEKLETPWSDSACNSGQCILNYTNTLTDKFFSTIKYAIIPRDVDCRDIEGYGEGDLKEAYMWPMSNNEFLNHQKIGAAIFKIAKDWLWTRTFFYCRNSYYCACYVSDVCGNRGVSSVANSGAVAPAFYLNKTAIDHITEDGEIVLKPASEFVTNK